MTDGQPRRTKFGVLIDEWQAIRRQLAEIEWAEHSDLVDEYDRAWTWWKGSLYRHCGFGPYPEWMIRKGFGYPSQDLLDNPDRELCDICKGILR
jgi:hypothetical protein